MAQARQIEQKKEDLRLILDTVKTMGKVSSAEIGELTGIPRGRVKDLLCDEVKRNPNLKSEPRIGYTWVKEETKYKDDSKYGMTKTEEGYSDPTAFLAMMKLTDDTYDQEPGTIWEYEGRPYIAGGDKDLNWVVVIRAYKGSVSCIDVKKIDDWYDPVKFVTISIKGNLYYIDPRRIMQRPMKQFLRMKYRLEDSDFNNLKIAIARHLDIEQAVKIEVKEVEKVVETVKEVPAAITEQDALTFLLKNGWMDQHDKEIMDRAREKAGAMSKPAVDALVELNVKNTESRIYKEFADKMVGIIYKMCEEKS